ncbi:MAG: beta-galactosidase [Bacteroidetes bacterium]|nr:beta-galactosidase [Bacteroidota bacterium]
MKRFSLVSSVFLLTALFFSCQTDSADLQWESKQAPIMSQWAQDVETDQPWDLYPRPIMERKNWTNLNGLWEYAITGIDDPRPEIMDGAILVPYPVESALSGVMKRIDKNNLLWYKRDLQISGRLKSQRLLIHFEAVDWHAKVWIDNKEIGEHKGGYSPFSFDISDYVNPGKEHELWISVWDPSTEGTQAVGKQNTNPSGIWYTPSSGIWQTVWLEKVPESYIADYLATPDIDKKELRVNVDLIGAKESDQLEVVVRQQGSLVSSEMAPSGSEIVLKIPEPRLWTPDDPHLYKIEINLLRDSKKIDEVKGYFGMRKISLGKDEKGITRIMLNNEFVFQNGPLDQGFWPDGLYTPPTEEAMVYDLKELKKMGFNMLRKHVKVENRRFYYWTDKLGLLVWQDMPNAHFRMSTNDIESPGESTIQFEAELKELVLTLDPHPSIVVWVPFNEGWGQYNTARIVDFVHELDPTRLINSASGWTDRGVGHILDIHNYPDPRAPKAEEKRAIVLGEFGGLGLPIKDHTWQQDKNWGYENMEGPSSLLAKYEQFYEEVYRLVDDPGLSAVVYTQTTDVEIETNGLMTYDRHMVKMGTDNIRKAHAGYLGPRLKNPITIFISRYNLEFVSSKEGAIIHYSLDGSTPDRNSPLFSVEIAITESTMVKAIAYWKNGESSRVSEFQLEKTKAIPAVSANPSTGLKYDFFTGAWEKIPEFAQLNTDRSGISTKLDLSPARGLTQDFALQFKAYLNVPSTDVYIFHVSSDDGGRLIIDGRELVNYDGIHGMGVKKAPVALERGFHPIEFLYFQHLGGLGLTVSWESKDIPLEEIGAKFFGH